jgi:hypothetical protein
MKHSIVLVLGLALAALGGCATDDSDGEAGGGSGSEGSGGGGTGGNGGDDVLPKRGEMVGDPTIVSAVAKCHTPAGASPFWWIEVSASDPKGNQNLGMCATTVGEVTEQQIFDEDAGCKIAFLEPCAAGEMKTVKILVSNETGGVTTATVSLELGTASGPTTPGGDDGGN